MSLFTNFAENAIADFFRGQTLTLPTNWYLALGSAGTDGSFTELSGTGYARQALARSLANWAGTQGAGTILASSGTSHATSNNVVVSWGTPGSAWGTGSRIGFFDASSAGNCWIQIPITAIVITTGSPDPVQVGIAAMQFVLGLSTGCSDYLANKMIDLLFRGQSFTWPATLYFALYTATPTRAGGGTEVSGGSYARASLVPSLANLCGTQSVGSTAASSGTGGLISNNAVISWPTPTADWSSIVAESIKDASTSGNQLFHKALTPKTVLSGSTPQRHSAGAMEILIDD